MDEETEVGIDDAVNSAMQSLEKDGLLAEGQEGATPDTTTPNEGAETPTEGEDDKPNLEVKLEAETPIEPPVSWRSDEKELFKNLPRETQEILQRLQQASDSHFTQRSTEYAQKIKATDDERQQYQTTRASYMNELGRLGQMASQLMPAKFQDIQSQADYLRLKATDPARASEYEAFQMTLQAAAHQQSQMQGAQQQEHLNHELNALLDKHPDWRQDQTKLTSALDTVRKTAVEYYGFSPKEVEVIGDHRYVDILQDASSWRQHQANLKSAHMKKTVTTPTKVLRPNAQSSSSLPDDKKAALLKRASKATNDREKANILSQLIG